MEISLSQYNWGWFLTLAVSASDLEKVEKWPEITHNFLFTCRIGKVNFQMFRAPITWTGKMILPSWNTFSISMGNFRWKLGKSCAWFCNARFSYSPLTFYSMQVWEVDSNNEFTTYYPYFVLQDNLCKSWKMQRSDALRTIFSHLVENMSRMTKPSLLNGFMIIVNIPSRSGITLKIKAAEHLKSDM